MSYRGTKLTPFRDVNEKRKLARGKRAWKGVFRDPVKLRVSPVHCNEAVSESSSKMEIEGQSVILHSGTDGLWLWLVSVCLDCTCAEW